MAPIVSVIIPTLNRCDCLSSCLESLVAQDFKDFEVLVVDAGSTDGTAELVNKFSSRLNIKILSCERGLVKQMNMGFKHASGDITIRTDDDIVATRRWLSEVTETFRSDVRIGGVTGPTTVPPEFRAHRDLFYFQNKLTKGGFAWRFLGKIYYSVFLEGLPLAVSRWFRSGAFSLGSNYEPSLKLQEVLDVDNLEGCNMAVRRDLFLRVGGFDESFVGIGEYCEPDLTFRIRSCGYRIVFNPRARIYHLPSKGGFFQERPDSYGRMINFLNFYFRHIRPNTVDKALRFGLYVLFLNLFFLYKFFETGQQNQLNAARGTLTGIAKNLSSSGRPTKCDV